MVDNRACLPGTAYSGLLLASRCSGRTFPKGEDCSIATADRGPELLADAKAGKNTSQQVIGHERARNLTQRLLGLTQVFGQ